MYGSKGRLHWGALFCFLMEPIFMGRIVQIAEASVSTSRINKQRKKDEEEWEKVKYSGWNRVL